MSIVVLVVGVHKFKTMAHKTAVPSVRFQIIRTARASKMNQTKNIKGNCQQCGGPFEFPVEGIGQTVDCPHCGKPTELQIAIPPDTSGISKRQIIYTLIAVVILVAGLVGVMLALKRAQRLKADRPESAQPAKVAPATSSEPSDPLAQMGFQASSVTVQKATSGSLLYAIGTVKNISSKKKFGVKVELELRDAQNWKLGTATDYVQSLEPGAEWKFRAMVMNSKTTTATILSIKEDQ